MTEAKSTPGPRKRGRPRKAIDSQQVPEKRRKQLRIAQQAYRRRKETTIQNLHARVSELEVGVEELSQSFLSLSNILFEEDLLKTHPRVASALQKITQQCVSLAEQDDGDQRGQPASAETAADTKRKSLQDIDLSFDTNAQVATPSFAEDFTQPLFSLTQWPESRPTTTPPYQEQGILPFGLIIRSPSPSFNTPSAGLPSPPATVSPSGLTREARWTLSHRIVRECCGNAYRLLTNTPNDHPRIQKVFGHEITVAERNRLITAFHLGMQDEVGDVLELSTQILDLQRLSRENWSPDQIARSSRTWQLVVESGFDQWLDASGVQRFLQQRGIYILEGDSPHSDLHIDAPSNIDMAAFIRRLSVCGRCVGPGPVFRKRDVEIALRFASLNDFWVF